MMCDNKHTIIYQWQTHDLVMRTYQVLGCLLVVLTEDMTPDVNVSFLIMKG